MLDNNDNSFSSNEEVSTTNIFHKSFLKGHTVKKCALPESPFLTTKQAYTYLNISRTSFWRYTKLDDFPKPTKVKPNRWLKEDLHNWAIQQ